MPAFAGMTKVVKSLSKALQKTRVMTDTAKDMD